MNLGSNGIPTSDIKTFQQHVWRESLYYQKFKNFTNKTQMIKSTNMLSDQQIKFLKGYRLRYACWRVITATHI